jgi:hypothetical protein
MHARRLVARGLGFAGLLALAGAVGGGPARAHEPEPFEGTLTLPLWMAAIDAQLTAGDVTTDAHASFGDILGDLNWAIEGALELRYQSALLLVDVFGNQTETDETTRTRITSFQLFERGPGGELAVGPLEADARTTMWFADAKLGWRALSAPVSRMFGTEQPDDPRHFDVDLFVGVRYWNVNVDLDVAVAPATLTVGGRSVSVAGLDLPRLRIDDVRIGGPLLRGGSRNVEQRSEWFDPLVGIRVRSDVTETISLFGLADLGGFGIGEASDLAWQGVLGGQWRFAKPVSLLLAYRALGLDRSGGNVDRFILHGPLLGLAVHF